MDKLESIILNENNMKLFFQYIINRYTIYKKRFIEQIPYPWTDDPILLRYKFTNIFRDLDPGTQYVIKNIIPKVNSAEAILFDIFIYRIYNKIQTFERVGLQSVKNFDKEKFESILRSIKDHGEPVFTNAFTVSGYHFIDPDADKIANTCTIIDVLHSKITNITNKILEHTNSRFTYELLLQQKGIGKFLAYQIAIDLGYWNKDVFNESDFVVAGLGCKKGIDVLFFSKANFSYEDLIFYLCDIQNVWFNKLKVNPDLLFSDREVKNLNCMAMENCLCEISKYLRAYYKTGRPKNIYKLS